MSLLLIVIEFTINTTKSYIRSLPEPISIKRGDVVAFYLPTYAIVSGLSSNTSYVLTYCRQRFPVGNMVTVSNATEKKNTSFWFQLHVAVALEMEIPIKAKWPTVPIKLNVSSKSALAHDVVKANVDVQVHIDS